MMMQIKMVGLLVVILLAHLASASPAENVKKHTPKLLAGTSDDEQWFAKKELPQVTPPAGEFVTGNIGFPRTVKSIAWKPTILRPTNGTCSNGYRLDRRQKMCRLVWK